MTYDNDIVFTLETTDKDGDAVSYSILDNDDNQDFPFSIDSLTGDIKMNPDLLNEVEKLFSFTVQLEDDGEPHKTTPVQCSFNVTDVNDKTPSFIFPVEGHKYWINVGSTVNAPLTLLDGSDLRLSAEDDDANDCFRRLSYEFDEADAEFQDTYKDYFKMNIVNGQFDLLKNLSSLSLEEDPEADDIRNLITLPVKVTDGFSCSEDHRVNRTKLKLKVFTDFEPKFGDNVLPSFPVDINETATDAVNSIIPRKQLTQAYDENNLDPPDGDESWSDQEIFYYFVNNSEAVNKHFYVDKTLNTLGVKSPLDVDNCNGQEQDCKSFSINIVSTNNRNGPPAIILPESVLNVVVTVKDLNDNAPYFRNIRSYYVYSIIDEGGCQDCVIQAFDDDVAIDTSLEFSIINQTSSDPAITNTTEKPFDIVVGDDKKSVEIVKTPNYSPDPNAQVYFDLELMVTDAGDHSSQSQVKIVIMTGINDVAFGFDNTQEHIENNIKEIEQIFEDVLEWRFSPKSLGTASSRAGDEEDSFTLLEGYFVDPHRNFRPMSQPEIATRYDERFDQLYSNLSSQLNISLDTSRGFRGASTDDWSNPDTRAAIIVGSVTAGQAYKT